MTEKRFTYTTRVITDKKGYSKDYIFDNETLLHTEQIVAILNAQADYIDYVTKERNLACNKLDNYKEKVWELEKEIHRWKTLYEIKDKEVTARVKRLNEICNRYKYAITFDKDIDPNDAVNILCDRILQTEVDF